MTATPPAPGSHAVRFPKENNANITKIYFIFSPVCNKDSTTKTRLKSLPKTSSYKAKYVNGIKIFMALIKSTANNIKTTTENIIALIGDVAELT